ncbi:peptidyl-tRNA hydrolase II [Basidiobolus meristosporus CBS 931.73]|uniref:peptidyl-tRNA hydrolase n=1 Tax=Basidiobolus meristosporus CBS 931.73 TaxID=1314790 RepID=A0A1Y1Y821_9FUNG|nr:peptidyl-tRNA hydrolase II [Basidiobolus meristosporus CBS 931.73]|eukprot:ORX93724.1 peptidyl-tRNA hydrolase II [Basidiobolus meristosporus CBS 931.73]
MAEPLCMFVVVRKDLVKSLGWPLGSILTQACHASTAALWTYREDPRTKEYVSNLDGMHKVVLETKNLNSLTTVQEKLKDLNIPYREWLEQPENIVTCLATVPVRKSEVKDAFKKCQLWK